MTADDVECLCRQYRGVDICRHTIDTSNQQRYTLQNSIILLSPRSGPPEGALRASPPQAKFFRNNGLNIYKVNDSHIYIHTLSVYALYHIA